MKPKTMIKKAMVCCTSLLGPHLPVIAQQHWICKHVTPLMLDEQILPNTLVERPLKGMGAKILCNPHLYTHRMPYWCGRLYETELENYLRQNLNPGDTVIDVGCNAGHISVLAAHLVDPGGRVIAFEPNHALAERVMNFVEEKNLSQIKIYKFALGGEEATGTLHLNRDDPGSSTLRSLGEDSGGAPGGFDTERSCEIRTGDEVLGTENLPGRVFLKVDVEGYETQVLEGMPRTLRSQVSHAVIEVTPRWLGGRKGVSGLFGLMADAGLSPHVLQPSGRIGPPLKAESIDEQVNVLFLRRPLEP
ncbi:MAG: FkbM family methyltransferase [Deltaproteobacteria bacterium]|nr:FkbM family methyltransferase [Deltaproteobacteria bacterium]